MAKANVELQKYKAEQERAKAQKALAKALALKYKSKQNKGESVKKGIKRREKATRGILTATGIIYGKQTYKGAGRPRGTFKYGMPIQVYKKMMRDKKALYQQYQEQQYNRLSTKGFTPEQIQQLQQQQVIEQPQSRAYRVQEQMQQMQQMRSQPPIQVGFKKRTVPTNMHNKLVQPGPSVADEELNFRKWSAERTISPRTQRILDTIRRIQNKGVSDNIEQQRRLRERNMVGRSMNLMKAHENMIDTQMDFTGVDPEQNILMAPSVFKEDPNNNILRNTRGSLGILNTREAGNDLHFF